MPDLSEMLGAVYGGTEDEPATKEPAPAHEWADDEQLDRAFAEWTPGPGADAPAAERSMFAPAPEAAPRLADDLAAALSEAVLAEGDPVDDEPVVEPQPAQDEPTREVTAEAVALTNASLAELEAEPEPAPIPIPAHKAGWQRSDDDIIPTGRSGRGRGISAPRPSLSRRPKASKPAKAEKQGKAPKGVKAAKTDKAAKSEKPRGKGLKREINFSFGKKK